MNGQQRIFIKMSKINSSKIARNGWLKVNLPVTILLIGSWLLLINFNGINSRFNALIAGTIGWIYWDFAITKWIRWALLQGIDKKELYKKKSLFKMYKKNVNIYKFLLN